MRTKSGLLKRKIKQMRVHHGFLSSAAVRNPVATMTEGPCLGSSNEQGAILSGPFYFS